MRPQTLNIEKDKFIERITNTNTFTVPSSKLQWGKLYPPTIFIEGIEDERTKFDFFKAYKNAKDEVLHCEYRSTNGELFKLIVYTAN